VIDCQKTGYWYTQISITTVMWDVKLYSLRPFISIRGNNHLCITGATCKCHCLHMELLETSNVQVVIWLLLPGECFSGIVVFGGFSDEAVEVLFRTCTVNVFDDMARGTPTEHQLILPG